MLFFKINQKISAEGYKKRNKTREFLSTSSMLGLLSACGGGGTFAPWCFPPLPGVWAR